MDWQSTPYAVPLAIAALLGAVTAAIVWRRRDSRAETWATAVQLFVAAWALTQLLVLSSATPAGKAFWLGVFVPVIAALVICVFCFTVHYTGRKDLLTRRRVAALAALPVVVLALGLTNDAHGLVFTNARLETGGSFATLAYDWGPVFHVVAAGGWALGVAYTAMLYLKFRRSRNVYRKQSFVLFASILILESATVVSAAGLSPFPGYTLLPLLYLVVGVVLALATVSVRFVRSVPIERALSVVRPDSGSLLPLARDFIVEEVHNGIVVLDTDGRVVDVNTIGKRMIDADRVVGRYLSDVVDVDEVVEGDEVRAMLNGEIAIREFRDEVWVDAPGADRCYDVEISELRDSDDKLAGHVVLMHDITRQKERERELRERERQLQRRTAALEREKSKLQHQNERLDQFASIVSHDLRNPLNVAMGHLMRAERQVEGDGDEAVLDAETVETVQNAHERMEALVEDTLTLARQGRAITETEAVDLSAVARTAWDNVDTGDAALAIDADVTVEADRDRLLTLFENLYRNAVEHGSTDHDDGLAISIESTADGFTVADDGSGIPDEEKDEVLEHGFTTDDDGTGLGLSIVRDIAGAHGWRIDVADSAAGGAEFSFSGVDVAGREVTEPTD